jgi:hypothetical protein
LFQNLLEHHALLVAGQVTGVGDIRSCQIFFEERAIGADGGVVLPFRVARVLVGGTDNDRRDDSEGFNLTGAPALVLFAMIALYFLSGSEKTWLHHLAAHFQCAVGRDEAASPGVDRGSGRDCNRSRDVDDEVGGMAIGPRPEAR